MENNNENLVQRKDHEHDNGALWAILLTIAMIAVMAILKHFIG